MLTVKAVIKLIMGLPAILARSPDREIPSVHSDTIKTSQCNVREMKIIIYDSQKLEFAMDLHVKKVSRSCGLCRLYFQKLVIYQF